MRDEALLEKIFAEHEISCAIHFAGLKAVGESVAKPMEYYQNNLDATLMLCKVMAKAQRQAYHLFLVRHGLFRDKRDAAARNLQNRKLHQSLRLDKVRRGQICATSQKRTPNGRS